MINKGDKIGLVGKMGWKIYITKVLSNDQTLNNGNINSPNGIKIDI